MRPVITWVQHSGIIELEFDGTITTAIVEYRIGNDLRRIEDLVDESILDAAIQVAKAFGYGSVTFHGSVVVYSGRSLGLAEVEKMARMFTLWAKLPAFEIRDETILELELDRTLDGFLQDDPFEDDPFDDDIHDWYDSTTPEGAGYLATSLLS